MNFKITFKIQALKRKRNPKFERFHIKADSHGEALNWAMKQQTQNSLNNDEQSAQLVSIKTLNDTPMEMC